MIFRKIFLFKKPDYGDDVDFKRLELDRGKRQGGWIDKDGVDRGPRRKVLASA